MNFEKLIEEQKKTQELLKRIDQTRTLSQYLEEVEPVALPFAEDMLGMADPWDYDALALQRGLVIGELVRKLHDAAGALKYYSDYIERLYEARVSKLTRVEGFNTKGAENRHKIYDQYYANPICMNFFEAYEADHPEVTPLKSILRVGTKESSVWASRKEYQHDYYLKVTKQKRAERRKNDS